jgi:hypothetical protein
MLDWLAERVGSEKPFLQYHALVAILLAVQGNNAKAYIRTLETTVEKISQFKDEFDGDSSRIGTLENIKMAFESLKAAASRAA